MSTKRADKQADKIDERLLLKSLRAFRKGDFSVCMPTDQTGIAGEIAEAFNDTVEFAGGFTGISLLKKGVIFSTGSSHRISSLNSSTHDCSMSLRRLGPS